MAATIREYLVSLGAEVDQKSFNKLKMALSGSMKTVTGFVGALAAVTTVLVKTSLSLDKTSQQYEAMAKKAKKTTEEIRAQETALKILGKTMDEVKADKQLKKQYDELVRLGKQMEMPGTGEGLTALREMVKTVNELRVVATYAMQWINFHMLNRIAAPLRELRKGLEKFKNTIKSNMPSWTKKVGDFLGNILRLATTALQGFGDLLGLFNRIPQSVKNIGAVLASVFTLSKMGGLGLLIIGLTSLLLLLDDFYTYQRGGKSAFEDLWKSLEGLEDGDKFDKILEFFSNLADLGAGYVKKLLDDLKNALNNIDWKGVGKDIASAFTKLFNFIISIIKGENQTFNLTTGALDVIKALFTGICEAIGSFISSTEWDTLMKDSIGAVGGFLENLLDYLFGNSNSSSGSGDEEEGAVNTILDAVRDNIIIPIIEALEGMDFGEYGEQIGAFVTNLLTSIGDFFTQNESGEVPVTSLIYQAGVLVEDVFNGILDFLVGLIDGMDFTQVGEAISNFIISLQDLTIQFLSSDDGDGKTEEAKKGVIEKFADLISAIISGLADAVGSIKWPDIAPRMLTIARMMLANIGKAISQVNKGGGEIVKSIATSITGMTDADWEKAFGQDNVWVGGFATAIGAKLFGASTGLSLAAGIGSALITASTDKNGFESALGDLATIGGTVWDNIVKGFGKLDEWIKSPEGKKFKESAKNLGNDIADAIFGEKDKDTGKRSGGIWDSIKDLVSEIKDSELFQSITGALQDAIRGAFEGLWEIVSPIWEELMFNLTSSIPSALKSFLGIEDYTRVTKNEDGSFTYKSTDGREMNVSGAMNDYGKNAAEIFKQYGVNDLFQFLDSIDKNPQLKGYSEEIRKAAEGGDMNGLDYLLNAVKKIAPNLPKNQWDTVTMQEMLKKYKEGGVPENYVPDYVPEYQRDPEKTGRDYSGLEHANKVEKAIQEYEAKYNIKIDRTKIDFKKPLDQLEELLNEMRAKAKEGVDVPVRAKDETGSGSSNDGKQAYGGRFDRATHGIFGEDGTEYIIPITKPNRAKDLILRMIGEMGAGASSILESLGVPVGGMNFSSTGAPGTSAAMLPGMLPAGGGGSITSNSGNTVSAPTTINVYGSSDPVATGNAAANASASNIVRRVRGCFEG